MLNKDTLRLYRRLLKYIVPYKLTIVLTLITIIIIAIMEPLTAAVFKELVDRSLIEKDPDSFTQVPLMLAGIFIVKGLAEYGSQVLSAWIAEKAILNIRNDIYHKIQYLSLTTMQKYSTGKFIAKITYDVQQASNALSSAWIVIIRDSLTILALLSYLLYISWQLTLLIFIMGPIVAFIINKASRLMRSSSTEIQNNMGQLTQQLEEGLNGYQDIKIYGAEHYEKNRFHKIANNLFKNTMRVTKVSAANVPIVQVLAAISLAVIVHIAMKMSYENLFTPGDLLAYVTAMALIFEPIRRITNINETVQKGMSAASSIFELLDLKEEKDSGTLTPQEIKGDINLKNIYFSYSTRKNITLQNFSLNIPANQTTALVGQSGSGKTTLVNLISRFYNPERGVITFDGVPISDIKLGYLRQQIAFVSQNAAMFNDTVLANIAYGHTDFNREEIILAAKNSHAWEFIEKLPQGLDTNIGEKGSLLSGGQRQRIAISRAFLKNSPILILDEATSALDNQSEAKIQQALEQLKQNRTVIIIAHRLSTVENADQIVVLSKGELIEIGNHKDLIDKGGTYADLYKGIDGQTL